MELSAMNAGLDLAQDLFAPLAHQMHSMFKIEFDFNITGNMLRKLAHHAKHIIKPFLLHFFGLMIALHHEIGNILMWAMSGLFHLLESLKTVECESDDLNSLDDAIMTAESNAEIIPAAIHFAMEHPAKLLLCTSEGINLIDWAETRFSRFMRHWFNKDQRLANRLHKKW